MKKLCIYCAGSLGRDLLAAITWKGQFPKENILFIDDVIEEKKVNGVPVFSFDDFMNFSNASNDYEFIIASGEPYYRNQIHKKLMSNHISIGNFISDTAIVANTVTYQNGLLAHWNSIISTETQIGCNVFVGKDAMVGHDVFLGSHSMVGACVYIGGWVDIGESTYIGAGAVIKDRIKIGSNVVVGAGSVVVKDVLDNTVVVGNPARVLRSNDKKIIFGGKIKSED